MSLMCDNTSIEYTLHCSKKSIGQLLSMHSWRGSAILLTCQKNIRSQLTPYFEQVGATAALYCNRVKIEVTIRICMYVAFQCQRVITLNSRVQYLNSMTILWLTCFVTSMDLLQYIQPSGPSQNPGIFCQSAKSKMAAKKITFELESCMKALFQVNQPQKF